jgi:hypothetical protein
LLTEENGLLLRLDGRDQQEKNEGMPTTMNGLLRGRTMDIRREAFHVSTFLGPL